MRQKCVMFAESVVTRPTGKVKLAGCSLREVANTVFLMACKNLGIQSEQK
jgi:hypothetical protein